MKSTRKIGLVLMVIFTMMVNSASAFDDTETRHIRDTYQDGFVLDTGTGIDANFVTVLSPDMDIRAMLYFEDMKPNTWHMIVNATLRLRTFHYRGFEAESKITIYGVTDYALFGYLAKQMHAPRSPAAILALPLTSASVNYNTSEFSGPQWHEIDVTTLVREMKNNRHYDGPGSVRAEKGDAMAFVIYGVEGYEPRSFYDYRAGNGQEAQLVIHWTSTPSPPSGGAFNESYRGLNIFEIDLLGANRTGVTADVNWNLLNMTELTEIDSGVAMTLNNDTWVSISAFVAQQHNAFYNDSGAANIDSFFVRLKINITSVTNNLGSGTDRVMMVASVGSATPVGGAGLLDDAGHQGNLSGVIVQVRDDDQRYSFRWVDRNGAAFNFGTGSPWYYEADAVMVYLEIYIGPSVYHWGLFLDEDFETEIFHDSGLIVEAEGPYRYPQVLSSLGTGASRVNTAEFYTFDHMPVANASSWTVTDENGTIIEEDLEDYEDAIIVIDNILGIESQDPAPTSQDWPDEGPLTRFQTRMFIWFMGYGFIFGPLGFFGYNSRKLSGYQFVIGCFMMVVGLGFLLAAGTV